MGFFERFRQPPFPTKSELAAMAADGINEGVINEPTHRIADLPPGVVRGILGVPHDVEDQMDDAVRRILCNNSQKLEDRA